MATVFDEIGKFHESNTDAAVIREEFLNNFDIKTPLIYETLTKSGPTPFQQARKLICTVKYNRESVKDIKAQVKEIKPSKQNAKLFQIITLVFAAQANWYFNNNLKQCIDGMTNAGMACMDWTFGTLIMCYCFAKKDDWDSASGTMEGVPTKTFDVNVMECAGILTDTVSDDVEMNKDLSAKMFIGYINNLRFIKKKKTGLAHSTVWQYEIYKSFFCL